MLGAQYRVYFDGEVASRDILNRIETITVRQDLDAVWEAEVEIPICASPDGKWADADERFMKALKRLRIDIKVGDGEFVAIFEGPLVGFDSHMSSQPGQSSIHLRGFDDSILLTRARPNDKSWAKKTASDIVKDIYSGLEGIDGTNTSLIEATNESIGDRSEVMLRSNLFDMLIELADLTERLVYILPGSEPKKCIGAFKSRSKNDSKLPPLILLGPERNIEAFEVSSDTIVASTIFAATLNVSDKTIVERNASYTDEDLLGDDPPIDPKKAGEQLLDPYAASTPYVVDAATGKRSDLAHVLRGHGRVRSGCYSGVLLPDLRVGIGGATEKQRGSYYIRSVTHTLTRSEYTQDFEVEREGIAPSKMTPGSLPELF
jgi:hypothetical protein